MARFDRYMLSQLLVLFGFFALVLVSVYWVNRAVRLFDQLIADGHSALIFLEFTMFSLPPVIAQVMPMAAFAAAVYVTNRLSADSELTVVQATGYSPWRLARPVVAFGLVLFLLMSALAHVLVPLSLERLQQREVEISTSASARLLREGAFLHPTDGVTLFIREVSRDGELRDIFLADRRADDLETTYTANTAYLLRDEGSSRLVMQEGLAQTLNHETLRLSTTRFGEISYDITALLAADRATRIRVQHLPTPLLLLRTQEAAALTGRSVGRINAEAHGRIQQPLLSLVAALVGFSTLIAARFSRFGVGRQIIVAVFLLVLIKLVESAVSDPVRSTEALWPLTYLPTLVGLAISAGLLHLAARPFPSRRGDVAA